jgi:Family of unknown function (DUF6650)
MKFREIASRLTGISSPIFGVSWNPPAAELTVARRVIAFLEDRRVLFADESIEVPSHCVSSVLELRRYLTSEIQQLADSELCRSLRAMRTACRKFMESVDDRGGIVVRHGFDHGHWASWRFGAALGDDAATRGRSHSCQSGRAVAASFQSQREAAQRRVRCRPTCQPCSARDARGRAHPPVELGYFVLTAPSNPPRSKVSCAPPPSDSGYTIVTPFLSDRHTSPGCPSRWTAVASGVCRASASISPHCTARRAHSFSIH